MQSILHALALMRRLAWLVRAPRRGHCRETEVLPFSQRTARASPSLFRRAGRADAVSGTVVAGSWITADTASMYGRASRRRDSGCPCCPGGWPIPPPVLSRRVTDPAGRAVAAGRRLSQPHEPSELGSRSLPTGQCGRHRAGVYVATPVLGCELRSIPGAAPPFRYHSVGSDASS